MSFSLELPRIPAGTAEQQLAEISRYLHEMAAQLNYALGFLDLPSASATNVALEATNTGVIEISENSTNAQQPSAAAVYKFVDGYAVPQTRTVNGHTLDADVSLTADDVGAASPDDVADAIADSEAKYADYVEDQGNTDGWSWRKWASGLRECWCVADVSIPAGGYTSWGSLFAYSGTKAYPSDFFSDVPSLIVSPCVGSGCWTGMLRPSGHTAAQAAFSVLRAENTTGATTPRVTLYARGI